MIFHTKNNRSALLRALDSGDLDRLSDYLQNLSLDTRKRFGPHPFDRQAIIDFYSTKVHQAYVAQDFETGNLVAYSIIKMGFLEHDRPRLESWGIYPNNESDCTFAPSVADAWQSCGLGNGLLHFILADLKTKGIRRMILWGGVQSDNDKAVRYYLKNGFRIAGQFQYQGDNYDMVLDI